MTDIDEERDSPPELTFIESWESSVDSRSTKERVYDVATTLTDPTRVAAVAERAGCSKGGARTNLEWLAELGVVEKVTEDPAMYRRNETYFDFLRVHRLVREHGREEIEDLIEAYEARERELTAQFTADSPADVDVFSTESFEDLDAALDHLSEWKTVRRRLRDLRRAQVLQQQKSNASEGQSPA